MNARSTTTFYLFGKLDSTEEGVNIVDLGTERLPDGVGFTEAVARALVGNKVVRAVVLTTVVLGVVVVDVDNLGLGGFGVYEVALGVGASLALGDGATVLGLALHYAVGALAKVAVVVTVAGTCPAALDGERTVLAGLFSEEGRGGSGGSSGLVGESFALELLESFLFGLGLGGEVLPVEVLPVSGTEFSEVGLHGFSVDGTVGGDAGLGVATLVLAEKGASDTAVGRSASDGTSAGLYTATASLGAGLEGRPGRNNAVDGASSGLALNGFGEERADGTSGLTAGDDGTFAGLAAATAGLGAGGEGTPGGGLAVDGAGTFVAGFFVTEDTAEVATEFRLGEDLAGSLDGAGATGGGADGPFGPSGKLAVDGALLDGASLGLLGDGASFATELGRLDNSAHTGVLASAAGLGASSPGTPFANDTVHGAALLVAEADFTKVTALGAAVSSSSRDGTEAELETHAAGLGALRESAPGREFAVDGAGASVAGTSLLGVGAVLATESSLADNFTKAGHGAGATSAVASGPILEVRHGAILGADLDVAGSLHGDGRAGLGAMGGLDLDRAGSELNTTTTANRAAAVFRPFGNNAGNGASAGVASFGLSGSAAFLAAEHVGTDNRAGAGVGTTAAGVGAGSPGAEHTNFAVNGAFVGVALARYGKAAAKLAAELRVGLDGAFTGLNTGAAGLGAGAVFTEFSEYAVNSASMGVALASLGVAAGAGLAAVLGSDEGLAGTGLDARTAGLGAGGEGAPLGNGAVSRAGHEEAGGGLVLNNGHVVDVLFSGRASLAAELGLHDDTLVAGLEASTAALGALGEFTIVGDDAVDGAGMGHALGIFFNVGALTAAEFGLGLDGTSALLGASTAGFGASRPGAEAGDSAVDGAGETVAGHGFLEAGASLAVEGSGNLYATGAVLGARGASAGAGRPSGEFLNNTVDGAGVGGAGTRLAEARAELATPVGVSLYVAVTVLVASTASAGAGGPFAEVSDNAINGALVFIAHTGGGLGSAPLAAVGSLAADLARAGLGATAAGLGAYSPGRPSGEDAVDGAGLGGAGFGLDEDATLCTAEGRGDLDGTVALLLARATGLGAGGESFPGGKLAVNRAGLGVASANLLEVGAGLATVGGRLGDGTLAGLVAGTAGTRALGECSPVANFAVNGFVLNDGAKVGVDPLRFVALGAAVVVHNEVEGGGALHREGRAGDLLTGTLVLGPLLDTVNEGLEHNTIAAVAVGVVEASAESEGIVLLVERVDEVRVGMSENAVVEAFATDFETALVPGLVNKVGTPANGGVVGGEGTKLFAFNDRVFPKLGINPFRFVTVFVLKVIGLKREDTGVLGVNREAYGLLAGDDSLGPRFLAVNHDGELDTVTTVAVSVIQTDTGAEHNKFLLQVVFNIGWGVGENSISVLGTSDVETLRVPVAVHLE